MFAFVGCDVGNSCEDIAGMGCGAFDTISVIDATLSRFGIHIKILKIVVEVHRSSTEISSE